MQSLTTTNRRRMSARIVRTGHTMMSPTEADARSPFVCVNLESECVEQEVIAASGINLNLNPDPPGAAVKHQITA